MLTFGNKVENGGTTPQGILTAEEFNALVKQVNANSQRAGGSVSGIIINGEMATPNKDGYIEIKALNDALAKLGNIEDGSQANKIEKIAVNGAVQPIEGKTALLSVPQRVSELTNDAGYVRNRDISATLTDMQDRIAGLEGREEVSSEQLEKIDSVEAGAQVNVLESVIFNGTVLPVVNKEVSINIDLSRKADLDENGKVLASQMPSYVDDVLDAYAEYDMTESGQPINIRLFEDEAKTKPIEPESQKIYLDKESKYQYRWTGTEYATIGAPTVIGEVAGTAYDGSKGKALSDAFNTHASNVNNPHQVTKGQVGLGNVDNTADKDKNVNSAIKDGNGNVITETYQTLSASQQIVTQLESGISGNLNEINTLKSDKANKADLEALSKDASEHISDFNNPHQVTKGQIGLGNVDNTADKDKPVSSVQQAALDKKADKTALNKLSTDTTTALDNKVDKIEGKGLSTNDYTTAEKNKLSGIASGAEVNTIVAVQRNGTAIAPNDRVVNILVPVKTSELNNDSTYQTAADVAETIVGVKLDLASGIITLTRKNGTTFTLDLPTEKIIKSGRYDNETKEIVLVLEDESEIRFSASELIDEYYADESTLELYTDTADGNKKKFRLKTAYKNKIDGSEQTTNKTASVSASSTETQYPTALAVYNAVKDLATKVQTFTTASTRANIESGETISTVFGKVRKWFSDLKAVAFSGSYNDLSNKPTIGDLAKLEPDSKEESFADEQKIIASQGNGVWGGTSYSKTALMMWNYIKSKIESVLGLTVSNYRGTANAAKIASKTSFGIVGWARLRNNNARYQLLGTITVPKIAYKEWGVTLFVKGFHSTNSRQNYIVNITGTVGVNVANADGRVVYTLSTDSATPIVTEEKDFVLYVYLDNASQSYAGYTLSILNDVGSLFVVSSTNKYYSSATPNGGSASPIVWQPNVNNDTRYRQLSGILKLSDSNLATYFNSSTGVLTIPNGVTTILFNTSSTKKVSNIVGTCAVNGYRLTIAGQWLPVQKTSSSTTGCFSSYIYGYRAGALGTSFDGATNRLTEAFEDFIYFNNVWYSKAY